MRIENLPSPGMLSNGIALQQHAMKAISAVEILAGLGSGKSSAAKPLSDFFTACVTALSTFLDVTAPTVVSRAIDTQSKPDCLRIRCSEMLDPKFVPDASAFVIAGVAKTVTKVVVDGPDIFLKVSVPWAAGNVSTVAYTQPGATSNLRDLSGNLLASFTAAAITNSLV